MKTWLSWDFFFEIVSSPNSSHLIMELRRALAIKAKGRVALGSKFFYSCWLHFCSKERLPQFLRHSCLLMGFVTPREESHFSSFYVMQMWSTLELSSAISFVKLSLAWVGSSTAKHYEFYSIMLLFQRVMTIFCISSTYLQLWNLKISQ